MGNITANSRLDPASLQVLLSRLAGVAEEMGVVLCRSAFSPNIKEREDCSSAIFTPVGELLAQAEHIPVHLGAMPASVRAVIERFGDACRPGDQFVVNDPFAGGTHLNDVTVVAPCFGRISELMTPSAISPDESSQLNGQQLLGSLLFLRERLACGSHFVVHARCGNPLVIQQKARGFALHNGSQK